MSESIDITCAEMSLWIAQAKKRQELLDEIIATFSLPQNQDAINDLPDNFRKLIEHWKTRNKEIE